MEIGCAFPSNTLADDNIEAFARRVRVPVLLAGVILIGVLAGAEVVHILLPVSPTAMYLLRVGQGGLFVFPFLYVVLGSLFGYAQRKEIDLTERPVVRITTLAGLVYGMVYRVALQIMTAVASDTCTACTSSQGAQTHLLVSASTQRETHARSPRLSLGRSGSAKEAEHVRIPSSTTTVATASAGGTRA